MPSLKVFRTTIGFHDVYVAAPSKAAALRVWGASTDLFAMGAAEQVDDARLMKKPLAQPGVTIKLSRGTATEHLEATSSAPKSPAKKAATPRPTPRPSRAMLDAAERRLQKSEEKFASKLRKLESQVAALRAKEAEIRAEEEAANAALQGDIDGQADAYYQAMDKWRRQFDG